MMKRLVNTVVISLVLVCFIGCTSDFNSTLKAKLEEKEVVPRVSAMIDSALSDQRIIDEVKNDLDVPKSIDLDSLDGETVVNNLLKTQEGKDYIYYADSVTYGNNIDIDNVLDKAESLLPKEQMIELEKSVENAKRSIIDSNKAVMKKIPASQRDAFLKDLQKLIVVSVVLLTAGIVYACIPTMVFWGKITAACAISVAAGMVAATVMSLYRYFTDKNPSKDSAVAFEEWLKEITTEPAAAYAMATGVIAMGSSLKRSPVVTGIILIVFALFNVIEIVKPMLKKYNFRM